MSLLALDEVMALAAEMDVLGQAIAASLDNPPQLLAYVQRRERCLERARGLLGTALPAATMLALASRFAAIDDQTDFLRDAVAERRDLLSARLARVRQGRRLRAAYAR